MGAPTPEVVSQKGALVGDDAVQNAASDPTVTEVSDTENAQRVARPEPAPSKVQVYETSVEVDKVVTDPSSPEAVQIPDAGRGTLDLPLHAHAEGARKPEEVFAADAKESESPPSES